MISIEISCYKVYYSLTSNSIHCSIDATEEDGRMGRLVNHSKTNANVVVKVIVSDSRPHLCMFASKDLATGQELQYDYGDRSASSIKHFQWLKN